MTLPSSVSRIPIMVDDVAAVAAGLTKAQRAYLTDKAVWRWPAPGHAWRWMTLPPRSTHRVLCRLGLMDLVGQISALGLSVRDHILKEQKG